MRIATANDTRVKIESINERRADLSRLQEQMSSGRRVVQPKDDPLAAANAERIRATTARLEVERRTIGYARQALGLTDGALSDATATLQTARELLLTAANPTNSTAERASIAQQLRGVREQLLAIANRSDGAGGYLFAGQGSTSPPFNGADAITYQAQTGERTIGMALEFTVSHNGNASFTQIPGGAAPENIFDRLMSTIRTLEDPSATPAPTRFAVNAAIGGIDLSMASLALRRTQVGEQGRQIDAHEASLAADEETDRQYLSDLIDVDLAKAISDVSAHETSLEASIKTYRSLSELSLFKYI